MLSAKQLGNRIKEAREAAELTQQELAMRLGMGQTTISNLENGVTQLEVLDLLAMTPHLGRSVEHFLGLDNGLTEDEDAILTLYRQIDNAAIRAEALVYLRRLLGLEGKGISVAESEKEIKDAIQKHIANEGGTYATWYIGVTNDAERRLFGEHRVNKENGWWVYRTAYSTDVARRVEEYFVDLGCDGGAGGGDPESKIAYAYKKTAYTNP